MARTYRCKFCGRYLPQEHGWDLCWSCNDKRKQGRIARTRYGWEEVLPGQVTQPDMIYQKKKNIQTPVEIYYYKTIKAVLPPGLLLFPQVALSAVIERIDDSNYQSELNRVLDYLVVNEVFQPCFAIELNDSTHNINERKQRDMNLRGICGEAGIYLEMLPTGMTIPQIQEKVTEIIEKVGRIERKPYIQKIVGRPLTGHDSTPQFIQRSAIGKSKLPWSEWLIKPKETSMQSWKEILLLAIFLGWLGVHRFCTGKIATGLLYAFTFGLLGIGWLIDVIRILAGGFTDERGRKIRKRQ